jgi:hypothetical protein
MIINLNIYKILWLIEDNNFKNKHIINFNYYNKDLVKILNILKLNHQID